MMHGQKISYQPMQLLQNAGFNILHLDEPHICCGSAGTYNILQPDIAQKLGQRKAEHIKRVKPDVVATGNLGCLTQMNHHSDYPVVHFVELLDWAYGGPCPDGLEHLQDRVDRLAKK
jgi:glycolate oxidase iron-sulfur subunit